LSKGGIGVDRPQIQKKSTIIGRPQPWLGCNDLFDKKTRVKNQTAHQTLVSKNSLPGAVVAEGKVPGHAASVGGSGRGAFTIG